MRHRAGLACALTITACGRIGFAPAAGDDVASGDGGTDVGVARPDCWASWRDQTVKVSSPRAIDELVIAVEHNDPWLAPDGNRLYFAAGAIATRDVYVAEREGPGKPFGQPVPVSAINSGADDTKFSMTDDRLVGCIASTRAGGEGGFDLWMTSRSSPTAPFGPPDQLLVMDVNDNRNQYDPELSADGLRIYLSPSRPNGQIIEVATRTSNEQAFGAPAPVDGLTVHPVRTDPSLSPDELVIVFGASPNLATPVDIYYATRASRTDAFSPGELLPGVSSMATDGDVDVSPDGCEVFLSSDRDGTRKLYVADVLP